MSLRRSSMVRHGTFRSSRREEAAHGTVVVDVGSSWTKVGVVGDASIRLTVATPRSVRDVMHSSRDENVLCDRLYPFLSQCTCRVPEILSTDKPPVVLTSVSQNPLFVLVLLRWLHANSGRAAIVCNTQLAALTSFGAASGVVLDVGWFSSRACCIIGGVVMCESNVTAPLGWSTVIKNIRNQFLEENSCFRMGQLDGSILEEQLLCEFVRSYGVVSPNTINQATESNRYALQLKTVVVTASPQRALELLFVADDEERFTIPSLVMKCSEKSGSHLRKSLFLTGGPTQVPNFAIRLARELKPSVSDMSVVHKSSSAAAILAPVLGGLSSLVALS
jgi:hypothetical protein